MIPWAIPEDMKRFARLTKGGGKNAVIMGRKTWESLPRRMQPLPGRRNIILSRSQSEFAGAESAPDLDAALRLCVGNEKVFVIGGSRPYMEALHRGCDVLHITHVHNLFPCDTFFPRVEAYGYVPVRWSQKMMSGETRYSFVTYEKTVNPEEQQYLSIVQDILLTGEVSPNRTGVDTLRKFGSTMRFSLEGGTVPFFTTKRVPWKTVLRELLWFVSGCTDASILQSQNVHIWDGNASREFLDGRGLTANREGDLGPVYGFQWRHWGAPYGTCDDSYDGQGVDQLVQIIETIKADPTNRRLIMSAWNVGDLERMALPPCHCFAQFYVSEGKLSCQMYQRSADMGLGVPFNVASYSILTHMVAHVCGLEAGEFIHVLGDTHVYVNHTSALETQLQRSPRPFPRLRIVGDHQSIDSFVENDFVLECYDPHGRIPMEMAV